MLATIIVGFLVIFFAYLARFEKTKYGLEISFIILTVFLALRYDFGNDYMSYLRNFLNYKFYYIDIFNLDTWISFEGKEPGWVFLNKICEPVGFFGMIMLLTVFEQYVLYRFVKKYVPKEWYWLTMFLYIFTTSLMLIGASMLRQYFAMTLLLIAVEYMIRHKPIQYLIIILIASSVHSSAYILFPFYLLAYLDKIKVGKLFPAFMVIIYIIWVYTINSYAADIFSKVLELEQFSSYNYYIEKEGYSNQTGTIFTIGNMYILVMLYCLSWLFYKNSTLAVRIIVILSIVSIFLSQVFAVPFLGRISYYFVLFTIFSFPICFSYLPNKYLVFVLVLGIIYIRLNSYFIFLDSPTWHEKYSTYKTIFDALYWM